MTHVRDVRWSMRGRFGALAAGTALLVVVGVLLTFGFVLLVALAVAGLLLGIGAALLRRLTGRPPGRRNELRQSHDLDPALEVRPPPNEAGSR